MSPFPLTVVAAAFVLLAVGFLGLLGWIEESKIRRKKS